MTSVATRDLASHDVWDRSLERSRRRRVLAEDARKTISRRRNASLAVSAAMATTPVIPSVVAGAMTGSGSGDTHAARDITPDHGQRILLKRGAVSPSVAQVQRKLNVADDGYYGPVTERAVKKFQTRHHLQATGMIDVKTWLKLFPDGMVIYAPHYGDAQLATHAPQTALRPTAAGTTGADVASVSKASHNGSKGAKGSKKRLARLKAAGSAGHSLLRPVSSSGSSASLGLGAGGVPTSGGGGGGGGGSVGGPGIVPHGPFSSASEMIAAMIAAANRIDNHHYAYSWGGGHNSSFSGPYDCSGAVSAVLHAAGLLSAPMVSGEFAHWGRPGKGAVTIYANASHVYMSILGRFFGTTHANPGGGAGWFSGAARPGFVVVHVPFEKMHFSKKFKKQIRRATRTRHEQTYKSVTPGYNGEAPGNTSSDPATGGATSPASPGTTAPTYSSQPVQAATTDSSYSAPQSTPESTPAASTDNTATDSSGSTSGSSGSSYSSGSSSPSPSPSPSYSSDSGSSGSSPSSGSSSAANTASDTSSSSSSGATSSGSSPSGSSSSGSGSSGAPSGAAAKVSSDTSSAGSTAGSTASPAAGSAESAAGSAANTASDATGSAGSSGSGSGSGQ